MQSLKITKQVTFQILLHGIVVAHKDVPAKNFIPRKRLRSRQSLKPLVNSIIIAVVVFPVVAQLFVSNNVTIILVNFHAASTFEVIHVVNIALDRTFAVFTTQVKHVVVVVVVVLETKLVGWSELRVTTSFGEIEVVEPFTFHPSLLSELGCNSGPFVILRCS